MVKEMRRSRQALTEEEIAAVMDRGTHGVLACTGDDGCPYAVPLSYVYFEGRLYFHSAKAGHKIDALAQSAPVSFAVVDKDTIVSEAYTSYFRSVIAFGQARIVEGSERLRAFEALVEKYSGDQSEEAKRREVAGCSRALIIAVDVEHITGKEALELRKCAHQ
jgi:nitroimidazol reductase NimA-like FMN-containing flavoprotein (pyridoxamine 5'-phosphate oxidase superfamily)